VEKIILNGFMRTDINKNSTKENLKKLSKELEKIINADQTNQVLIDSIKKWAFKIKEFSLNRIVS